MMKKIAIAVDLQDTKKEQLRALRDLEFLKCAEIHFVYVYQTTSMIYGLGEFCQVYPLEFDRKGIGESLRKSLENFCQDTVETSEKVLHHCLFDPNPREKFCAYAKEEKADMIIILTRERHGFFESSFAQFAARHSPCHTLILRP